MMSDRLPLSPYRAALTSLRRGLWGAAGLSAMISVLMLTGSIYMLQVYNRVLTSGSVATLLTLFAIVVMLHGFLALYDGLRKRLLSRLALRLDTQLAGPAFEADLLAQKAGARAGSMAADLELLRNVLAGPATLALFDLPFTALFLSMLFVIHPLLGWTTLLGMGLAAGLAYVNHLVLAQPIADTHAAETQQRRFAEQTAVAAPTIVALGMTQTVVARWLGFHNQKLHHQQRGFEPSELLSALSRSLRMLLQSALLTVAAWLVIKGDISSGAIVASSILSGRALAPVDQMIGQWRSLAAARAAQKRLMRLPPPPERRPGLPSLTGTLEVKGLTRLAPAAAGSARNKILDDISFTLAPGAGLGIVGTSASGKSTLARLIVGALAPDGGEIRFDGATAQQWGPDGLGRQIGYLPQRVDLLPGTVRDNIARFDPQATDEAVIAAAQAAGVHEMILRLPEGYATDLNLSDMPLSGGQIQRIGLARALYGTPRILILDEPNAHLDLSGEAALARCIAERRAAGVTVIVFAHRIGALSAIDRMIVLQNGTIAQDGPRDAVLAVLGSQSTPKTTRISNPKIILRGASANKTEAPLQSAPKPKSCSVFRHNQLGKAF